ncbi:MAG: cache domain-containing protein [Pseudomonadota bacterium]|nr:cache domain-containing protein [Pseudomonadota bacterium]
MKNETRIFIALFIIIAASDTIFVGINYFSGKASLQNNFVQVAEKIRASYDQSLAATELRMLQTATYVAADPEVQNLFLAGKRAVEAEGGGPGGVESATIRSQLHNEVHSSRDAVAAKFDFRQLHFHLGPGSLSFLRAHRPEKFGDRMDSVRHTVVAVNESHKAVSGFETGRVYSGIRGVVPVYAAAEKNGDKIFVGALEAGTSFDVTINELAKLQKIEFAVLLTLDHLKENVWPEFIAELSENNPPISGYFIEATTDPYITRLLRKNVIDSSSFNELKLTQVDLNNNCYNIALFPLRDFIGSIEPKRPNVGVIVTWWNVQKEVDAFWANQRVNIIFGILGFILIEILIFVGLRLSTRKLKGVIDEANIEIINRENLLKEAQCIGKFGHWEIDLESKNFSCSDQVSRIFNLDPQQFEPWLEAFFVLVHPDDHEFVKKAYEDLLENKLVYDIKHRIVLKDGVEKWVREVSTLKYDDNGKPISCLGTIQDITERQLMAEKALENIRLQEECKRLESLKTFAGAIAHRFNNSMTAVLGNLELLEMSIAPDSPEMESITDTLQAAKDASRIGSMMLTYVGQRRRQIRSAKFEDIVRESLTDLKSLINPSISLEFTSPSEPLYGSVDSSQIKEVICSVLTNAIESLEGTTGTIKITFGTENYEADSFPIPFQSDKLKSGLYSFCRIIDSGNGINKADLPRVFDPFFTTKFVGRGLGLALTVGIMQAHNGGLIIESDPDTGTTVKVLLPALTEEI